MYGTKLPNLELLQERFLNSIRLIMLINKIESHSDSILFMFTFLSISLLQLHFYNIFGDRKPLKRQELKQDRRFQILCCNNPCSLN